MRKEDGMELTMAEKRDLIERITELAKHDVLNREDRDDIFRICLVACDREMAKLNKKKEG
jgi:hypothetical protein